MAEQGESINPRHKFQEAARKKGYDPDRIEQYLKAWVNPHELARLKYSQYIKTYEELKRMNNHD